MCGIVGYVGKQDTVEVLVAGLRQLEYRGYDSAGIAVLTRSGLKTVKAAGRIADLEARLPRRLKGSTGIGHTRWATHGEPTDANAHPHMDCNERFAIAHNGIIENANQLREELIAAGHVFRSETDSEVIAHLVEQGAGDLESSLRAALARVEGTFGIVAIDAQQPDCIVAARNGSPVVLGVGQRELFVASDVAALVRHTRQAVYLDDGEMAVLEPGGFRTATLDARPTLKEPSTVAHGGDAYDLGSYEHFMLKEIREQAEACERTIRGRLEPQFQTAHLGGLNLEARDLLAIRRIKILGCGSAYYSGMVGAHLLEGLARIPADAEPASEFRYRNPVVEHDCLYIFVSQSGETADTLAALREVKRKGGRVLGVINSVGSTIARECDGGIYLHAGPEVSVAATKSFTCTSVAFALLALHLGRVRDLSPADGGRIVRALQRLPEAIQRTLAVDDSVAEAARKYRGMRSTFFVGRAASYPIALEGAQKLKEVSYVHAEAYPAAELKHGPLALISPETPTVAVLPKDHLFEKSLASIAEIKARRGPVIAIAHNGDERLHALADDVIAVPALEPELDPILLNLPLQLFAYEMAIALGRDVDRPRNLAKSVTVE